jgi:hypothetical protein
MKRRVSILGHTISGHALGREYFTRAAQADAITVTRTDLDALVPQHARSHVRGESAKLRALRRGSKHGAQTPYLEARHGRRAGAHI